MSTRKPGTRSCVKMGLNELIGDNTPITSRRKVENHTMSKHKWKWVICHDPSLLSYITQHSEGEELKMWINLIDDILDNGVKGVKVGVEQKEDLENEKERLMEKI